MKTSLTNISNNIIWLLTVFLFTTFLVFETYSWGRYAFFGASALILLLSVFTHHGKLMFRMDAFYKFMLVFIGYTLLSSLWAMNPADSVSKAVTIFQILVCAAMLYIHYQHMDDVQPLLTAVMWAGYLVALYTIFFFGTEQLMEAAAGDRLGNEYSNVNSIGMAAAYSCTIQVSQFLHKKNHWSVVFMIPAIVVIAATQSRKALALLVAGVFGVYVMKNFQNRGFLRKIFRIVLTVVVFLAVASLLYSLPVFDGVRERMGSMFGFVTGDGGADSSTILRFHMMELGLEWFVKYPIAGIGIGNAHILAAQYLGHDTYLHNNFVELLCSGGIIGFCIYYAMYAYLFKNLWKYRRVDYEHFMICLVWQTLLLAIDFGMVSYSSKSQWFYLMILFLNVQFIKRKMNST